MKSKYLIPLFTLLSVVFLYSQAHAQTESAETPLEPIAPEPIAEVPSEPIATPVVEAPPEPTDTEKFDKALQTALTDAEARHSAISDLYERNDLSGFNFSDSTNLVYKKNASGERYILYDASGDKVGDIKIKRSGEISVQLKGEDKERFDFRSTTKGNEPKFSLRTREGVARNRFDSRSDRSVSSGQGSSRSEAGAANRSESRGRDNSNRGKGK